jgi:dihydroflavonol-4-reductase
MMISPLSLQKVLVTGANGFIGMHTTLHLLQLGYSVRASVRVKSYEQSIRETLSRLVDTSNLEFAQADLLDDIGWQQAVHGCNHVIHTASPYTSKNPKDQDDLFLPARDGTLRVLYAAQEEGIKRVVILSSIGAIYGGHNGENRTFDETDWTNIERCRYIYFNSKTLAERAAWDYIDSVENKNHMEMAAINPPSVFGPVLDAHQHTSVEYYQAYMRAEVPGVAQIQLDLVDVRDLVDIFVKAMMIPEAAGKRYICNAASIPLPEFVNILHDAFSNRGYRIPTRAFPDQMVRFLALFIPQAKSVVPGLKWKYTLSTEQAKLVFGWQPRPYKQTILDMAESLIKYGLV